MTLYLYKTGIINVQFSLLGLKQQLMRCHRAYNRSDVTPEILSCDFVAQLYRAIKSLHTNVHVATSTNSITSMASRDSNDHILAPSYTLRQA